MFRHSVLLDTQNTTEMTRFSTRSLFDGLRKISRENPFLAFGSFFLILFISSVIPLSFFWLFQCLFLNIPMSSSLLWTILTVWSTAEVIFLIYQAYLYSKVQNLTHPPNISIDERDRLVSRVIAQVKNLPTTLSKWFHDRPFEELDRASVLNWLAFAFYSRELNELNSNEYEQLNSLLNKIQVDYRLNVNDRASNSPLAHMKHILDPVRVIFRPLIFYVVTDTLLDKIAGRTLFYLKGYKFVRMGHLQFWTNREEKFGDEEEPIIFFHGIGAGLLMYQPFITRLTEDFSSSRRLIFVSMRCICMRYPSLNDIPNMNETVESMQQIFQYYQFKKAIFIGHSYGTACLSWIVQKCPQYISQLIFLDPICFALFEPYVIYNFVYRLPSKLGQLYMFYFVCRELGISFMISRHFWWTQNNLFLEEIPRQSNGEILPTHVLLSGRDCIVNVRLVREYLMENNIDYYWIDHLSHGGFMHHPESWRKISQWISEKKQL